MPPPPRSASSGQLPAGLGSRLGATLIDAIIAIVAFLMMFGLYASVAAAMVLVIPMWIAVVLYPLFLLARQGPNNGQTIGKQVVGIRVVPVEGGPITMARAASRELLWKGLILGLIGGILIIPSLLNLMWPLFDDLHRALHDKGAATLVVAA